jgi:hypothetical protein
MAYIPGETKRVDLSTNESWTEYMRNILKPLTNMNDNLKPEEAFDLPSTEETKGIAIDPFADTEATPDPSADLEKAPDTVDVAPPTFDEAMDNTTKESKVQKDVPPTAHQKGDLTVSEGENYKG